MSKPLILILLIFTPLVNMTTNSFLDWAQHYAEEIDKSNCWVCGLLPISSTSGLPWWVSPLQGSDWTNLQDLIYQIRGSVEIGLEGENSTTKPPVHPEIGLITNTSRGATRYNISEWPIITTIRHPGHNKSFTLSATIDQALEYVPSHLKKSLESPQPPTIKDVNYRYYEGYYQIWDDYLWLTPIIGQLSQNAPLCWEQRNHTYDKWENTTKKLGWIPLSNCETVIVLKATDWYATNWEVKDNSLWGIRWRAPNGTKWLCGNNLWPWLPPGWVGRCTIGFPWVQGRWIKTLEKPANLPVLKQRWTRSVFHWYDHLASIFVPSVGLEDVIWHIESLTKFTQKALNDTAEGISLLNSEVKLMRQAVLQNRMALDILTAAQGGTCAIIKTECCVYIPDNSANVSSVLQDLSSQISSMSDSALSFNDILASWFSGASWWKKVLLAIALIVCGGLLLCCLLYCLGGICCSLIPRVACFPLKCTRMLWAQSSHSIPPPESPMMPLDQIKYKFWSRKQAQHPVSA
jgi:hypothetical protein